MKNLCFLGLYLILSSHSNFIKAQTDEIAFLSILSPANLVNTFYRDSQELRRSSGWGKGISGNNLIASAKIPDVDELLCTDDKTDFTGKIALIRRGLCEFSLKALNAQNRGAIAVIIVNFENTMVSMGVGAQGSQINIPVIMVTKDVGDLIIQNLQLNQELVLSMGNYPEGLGYIHGKILMDKNGNCKPDSIDIGLKEWNINIRDSKGSGFIINSDSKGNYKRFLNPSFSPYTLNVIPPNSGYSVCEAEKIIQLGISDTINLDFTAFISMDCVELHTEISASRLRSCFKSDFIVQVCNQGTATSHQSYVDVGLASEFDLIEASLPFTIIGSDLYRFQMGEIQSNDCILFNFNAMVNCDSSMMNQTLCYFAHAYPDTSCIVYNPLWSGANIKLEGKCTIDTVEFTIKNAGQGDMNSKGTYLIVEDQQLYKSSTYQLKSSEQKKIMLPNDGTTWHMEVSQDPYNPNPSVVSKTIEACSNNGNFNAGLAMMFPPHDEGFAYDEECQMVRGSYDPNEKEGFPYGFGSSSLIKQNSELEYTIRFQNTGNDTAFKVVVEDILPLYLDPVSIHSIVSSHPYSMEIVPNNKLIFNFDNIKLVDSFTNESGSNGFVSFKIRQKSNLASGVRIENSATIYFDYNLGVNTNSTYHEVGNFVGVVDLKNIEPIDELFVFPNPVKLGSVLQFGSELYNGSKWNLIDIQGQKICFGKLTGSSIEFPQNSNLKGFYFLEIIKNDGIKVVMKIEFF